MQQGDVLLFQTLDGGNISLTNNQIDMTTGLETAVYLSLFSPEDWFLNDIAETENEKLTSQTEQLIATTPNVSSNYTLLDQAINNDLKWLLDAGRAKSISVGVSSNQINRVNISLEIDEIVFNFNNVGWETNGN